MNLITLHMLLQRAQLESLAVSAAAQAAVDLYAWSNRSQTADLVDADCYSRMLSRVKIWVPLAEEIRRVLPG